MSETPNEPHRRASLRGKGWEILRGSEPPDDLPPPQDVAPPEVDETSTQDDTVLDWMAAPELSKLKASPPLFEEPDTAYDLADFEDLEVDGEPVPTFVPVESAEAEVVEAWPEPALAADPVTEALVAPEESEAVPPIERLLAGQPPVSFSYAARPEVVNLVPADPEALREPAAEAVPVADTGGLADVSDVRVAPRGDIAVVMPDDAIIRPQDVRIDAGRLAPVSGGRPPAKELFGEAKAVRPDESLLSRFVTDERLDKLWNDIDKLQEQIVQKVQGSRDLTDTYQKELLEASALLLQDRANYDDVRAIIYRVRADLAREEKVRQDTEKYKPQIIRFLFLAFVLWVILMAVEPLFGQFMTDVGLGALGLIYHPTMFGMLGAIVYAYFTLNRHAIHLRDFDPVHVSWYLMNPFIGIIMGLLMTLVFTTGIVSTIGVGLLDQAESAMLGQFPFLLWVLCFLAGYNQNVVLRLLYRTFSFLRGKDDADESTLSSS